jgi:dihydrofolate reductase
VSTVSFDISMSLDGYVRAPDPTREEPLGRGGEALHEWAMAGGDADGRELLDRSIGGMGALICGRNTYDHSLPYWDAGGPTGPARVPLFVVTHKAPSEVMPDSVFTFVETGVEDALAQAKATAGEKNVGIMAPNVATQLLRAGLVDQVAVHVVPKLFGGGLRLVETLPENLELELAEHTATAGAIHLRYRVERAA